MGINTTPAHPAATVVLLRDNNNILEILLLRRNSKLSFHGGAWVFPGGRIDPKDYVNGNKDELQAAKQAAVRETKEESGISISLKNLVLISQWTTPPGFPKRFKAWFFITKVENKPVLIDGCEIKDYKWLSPSSALEAQNNRDFQLPVPTYMTIQELSVFPDADTAIEVMRGKEIFYY